MSKKEYIDRESMIAVLRKWHIIESRATGASVTILDKCSAELMSIPPAKTEDTEDKNSEWIVCDENDLFCRCAKCGNLSITEEAANYCSLCGRYMLSKHVGIGTGL